MRVLSLFDYTGIMVEPWANAGHECTIVDVAHERSGLLRHGITAVRADVAQFEPDGRFDIVFAFPPCTHLASSGARWWAAKGEGALRDALALVARTMQIIVDVESRAWMVENPVGRLSTYWRKPDYAFDPCDFGGYLSPHGDAYTKRTCLWTSSTFRMPTRRPVEPVDGSRMPRMGQTKDRARLRSATPRGFAEAVYLANRA